MGYTLTEVRGHGVEERIGANGVPVVLVRVCVVASGRGRLHAAAVPTPKVLIKSPV